MKIKDYRTQRVPIFYEEVKNGQIFERNGILYMAAEGYESNGILYNAVKIENGRIYHLDPKEEVYPINGYFAVCGYEERAEK